MNIIWICLQARARGSWKRGALRSRPGKRGSLTVAGVILSHLHLLHAVSREPARAAFHGPLPKTALPNAEHWGDRSQTGCQGRGAQPEPTWLPPAPDHHLHYHHPTFPSLSSSLPSLHPPGFFPGKILGSTRKSLSTSPPTRSLQYPDDTVMGNSF